MQTLLLVIELLIAIALIIFVLLQRSEGGALGMGGGGSGLGGLFSPRGASDTLSRTTALLGVGFFVVCLALNLLVRQDHRPTSILDSQPLVTHAFAPLSKPASPASTQPGPLVPTPH
jgi:preprotein translocase subunit SecG